MSFSTNLAALVTNQLQRFVTLNAHQLAGQVANLDFWLGQVRHAVATLDGYGVRFVKMQGGQEQYVATHSTTVSVPLIDGERADRPPPPPHRIPDRVLQKARRELLDVTEQFLMRCRDAGLLSETELTVACKSCGITPGGQD